MPKKKKAIEISCPLPHAKAYRMGGCNILVAKEPQGGIYRWHLSIAHPKRIPTWDEIHDARYALLPEDATFAMILPPPEHYVNMHEFCMHLWEVNWDHD